MHGLNRPCQISMPNEVFEQVHRPARTAEKYEGIVFTHMQGNIQQDQINDANNSQGTSR